MRKATSSKEEIVAVGVRMEIDDITDDVFIVFKITDPAFKQKIRENWLNNIELKVMGKNLIKK